METIFREMKKPTLYTVLSPALLHLYDVTNTVVVVIDVLRATSTIATALYNGAKEVIPVDSVERCIQLGKELECITAGERDGQVHFIYYCPKQAEPDIKMKLVNHDRSIFYRLEIMFMLHRCKISLYLLINKKIGFVAFRNTHTHNSFFKKMLCFPGYFITGVHQPCHRSFDDFLLVFIH